MKLLHLRVLLLTFLINCNAYASNLSLYLDKGSPTPYDGYLISPETAQEVTTAVIERDGEKLLIESYNRSLALQAKQINSLQEQSTVSDLHKILWFGLGAAATVLISYSLHGK